MVAVLLEVPRLCVEAAALGSGRSRKQSYSYYSTVLLLRTQPATVRSLELLLLLLLLLLPRRTASTTTYSTVLLVAWNKQQFFARTKRASATGGRGRHHHKQPKTKKRIRQRGRGAGIPTAPRPSERAEESKEAAANTSSAPPIMMHRSASPIPDAAPQ